jgi:NADH-quinone oxidoreductase subunit A
LRSGGQNIVAYWPLLVFVGLVVVLIALMMVASFVFGTRHRAPARGQPYETGVLGRPLPQRGFAVQFYRMAVFFVIFDVEAVFIFAWAVSVRESGWDGFIEMLIFIAVLVAALVYLWRLGSLDWRSGSSFWPAATGGTPPGSRQPARGEAVLDQRDER